MIKVKFFYNDLQVEYIKINRNANSFEDELFIMSDLKITELNKHDKKNNKILVKIKINKYWQNLFTLKFESYTNFYEADEGFINIGFGKNNHNSRNFEQFEVNYLYKLSKNEEVDFFKLVSGDDKTNFMRINTFLAFKNKFDFKLKKFNEEIDCMNINCEEEFYYILSRKLYNDSTFCICGISHFDDFRIDLLKNNDNEILKSSVLTFKNFDNVRKNKRINIKAFQEVSSLIPIKWVFD